MIAVGKIILKANIFKVIITLFTSLVAASALATSNTLGEYNLILIEDYNFQGGDVEGSTIIGGDLNASGYAVDFGSRLENTDTAIDAVTIVGDVNANQVKVLSDNNVVYGGTLNATIEINNGDDGEVIYDASLSIADIVADLYADSAYFASLDANGTFDVDANESNKGVFTYTGSESLAVFSVDASELDYASLDIDWGSAETVVINVYGTDVSINSNLVGGFNDAIDQSTSTTNVLWNFVEAESIDFGNTAMKGAVLAPFADTTGGASFDGSFAAVSYTGSREFHNYVFDYDTPEPPTEVPAPAAWLMMLVASVYLLRRNRK